MLDIKNLSFGYKKGVPILKNVNFSLDRGEILTVIGANGAGKSTLFNCISGLLDYHEGEILIDDENIKGKDRKWLAKKIAFLGQVSDSRYYYSVREYLLMGRNPYISFGKSPGKKDYEIVENVAEEFGLSPLMDRFFNELSGGQKQKIRIARAVVQDADIILLDEPTNHLDLANQYQVINIIKHLRDNKKTVLLTTHTPEFIESLGGRLGIITRDGEFLCGNSGEMLDEKMLYDIYKIPIRKIYVDELEKNIIAIDWSK